MGILTNLLMLPVAAPVVGSLWIGRQIARSVEQERNSPSALREALREAEARLLAGDLSEEDYDVVEMELLMRLKVAAE